MHRTKSIGLLRPSAHLYSSNGISSSCPCQLVALFYVRSCRSGSLSSIQYVMQASRWVEPLVRSPSVHCSAQVSLAVSFGSRCIEVVFLALHRYVHLILVDLSRVPIGQRLNPFVFGSPAKLAKPYCIVLLLMLHFDRANIHMDSTASTQDTRESFTYASYKYCTYCFAGWRLFRLSLCLAGVTCCRKLTGEFR